MRVVTVAGPPSSGKTSVILHVARALEERGARSAVVKFDCLSSQDRDIYEDAGVPVIAGVSANMCPDHYYASNIEKALGWARGVRADVLFSESAGLCNRCSPHIKGLAALCVIDCLSGSRTPAKVGPMLRLADMVVVTKGDIVSQAEREVFAHEVRTANPQARVAFLNGITGQGTFMVERFVGEAAQLPDDGRELRLRFTMPSALCSYCMGQTRIGKDYRMGAVREMEVPGVAVAPEAAGSAGLPRGGELSGGEGTAR